jgi:L-asparagine transporter-like permease
MKGTIAMKGETNMWKKVCKIAFIIPYIIIALAVILSKYSEKKAEAEE